MSGGLPFPALPATRRWAVVVPVKGGPTAKSRLDLPAGARMALAEAFARDTLAALLAAPSVASVLVVTGDDGTVGWARSLHAGTVADPGGGLDAAVAAGVETARRAAVDRVAVVLGDHPALRAVEVETALLAASRHERVVLADAQGSGTALLTAPVGAPLPTAFGAGSAGAHRALGHHVLRLDVPGLRLDVDDAASLATAVLLGVGAATRAALQRLDLPATGSAPGDSSRSQASSAPAASACRSSRLSTLP
ncbi:2-phospho-L-lactate guanylyltransferase [Oryzobacter sp. R7]|uniref:2-phospho-L-lactate guanylyltransferase n=1 Tax=Oryzobacter faecalis TaxID=3388656 RepID=UPI00398CE77C